MKKILVLLSMVVYLNAGSCAVDIDSSLTLPTVAGIDVSNDLVFNDLYGNINCDAGLEVTVKLVIENAKIKNTLEAIDDGEYSTAIVSDYFKINNTNLIKLSSEWDKDPSVYPDAILVETWSYVGQGGSENILLRLKNSGMTTCVGASGGNCPAGNAQSNVQMILSW